MAEHQMIITLSGATTEDDAERIADQLWKHLKAAIRPPLPPQGAREEPPRWVLVKGYHDSGTIDAVLGPYDEDRADWMLANALDTSCSNWTKVKLSSGPEGA